MIVILLLWVVLILYGIGRNEEGSPPLELNQTIALRGICAVEIMIGHIGLLTGNISLYLNRKAGILFVGIFFMLSGYGLAYGNEHKQEYMKSFLPRRFWRLLLPAYLAYAVYVLCCAVVFNEMQWTALFDLTFFFHNINWYVWEQLGLYAVFWLAYQFMPRKMFALSAVLLLSVIFVGIAFVTGMDMPYYGSTLCFAFGLYYFQYEEWFARTVDQYFWKLLAATGGVLAAAMGMFFVLGDSSILGNPVARNIASTSFCMMVILLLGKISVGNRVSYLLGKCSYEIFLVHPFVFVLLMEIDFASQIVYSVVGICISILTAAILHLIVVWIERLTEGKRKCTE